MVPYISTFFLTDSITYYLLTYLLTHSLTHSLTTRLGQSLTSISHRPDSKLKRLAAGIGGNGVEEGWNAPAPCQIVQARLLLFAARTPPTRETSGTCMDVDVHAHVHVHVGR